MKILPIIAAAAVALVAMPAAASAAPAAAPASVAQHVTVRINDRHHGMRGRHHGWRNQCTTTWRHHRRVRTCHRVRW
jgi:Spy/CpxP family protein refolding chaperone